MFKFPLFFWFFSFGEAKEKNADTDTRASLTFDQGPLIFRAELYLLKNTKADSGEEIRFAFTGLG
jgi:hypothetical protein